MVATTFAATRRWRLRAVYAQGVAGNWLWWSFSSLGHDDGFSVCAIVAALRGDYRRAVCGDALPREAGGVSPGVSRGVPGIADELPDSGWVTKAMVNIISTSLGISGREGAGDLVCFF